MGQIYIKPEGLPAIEVYGETANVPVSETHDFQNEVVSQPLEDGTSLFDHIVIQPDELDIVIHSSNAPRSGERYPSQSLFSQLKEIRNKRVLCQVSTLHEIYRNMALVSVNVPNSAPFPGRVDITLKFRMINIVSKNENIFPIDCFEPLNIDSKKQWEERAKTGTLSTGKQDVTYSAMSETDIGEQELAGLQINTSDEDVYAQKIVDDPAILNNVPSNNLKSAYATAKQLVYSLKNAYLKAGVITANVQEKIQSLCAGVSYISNLSLGVQRLYTTIKGQVIGISTYFDVLTNNWGFSIKTSAGQDVLAGAALVVGLNVLDGLLLNFPTVQLDGTVIDQPLNIKAIYLSPPISSEIPATDSVRSLDWLTGDGGMASTPYAFVADGNGVAPCSLIVITDDEIADNFKDLWLGTIEREQNFDLNEYTFLEA